MKIDCGNEEKAKIVNNALKVDNKGYIKSYVEGKYIFAEGRGDALSIIHTINDFLSCLQMALKL